MGGMAEEFEPTAYYSPEFKRFAGYWFPVTTALQLGDLYKNHKATNLRCTIVRPYNNDQLCMAMIHAPHSDWRL